MIALESDPWKNQRLARFLLDLNSRLFVFLTKVILKNPPKDYFPRKFIRSQVLIKRAGSRVRFRFNADPEKFYLPMVVVKVSAIQSWFFSNDFL